MGADGVVNSKAVGLSVGLGNQTNIPIGHTDSG